MLRAIFLYIIITFFALPVSIAQRAGLEIDITQHLTSSEGLSHFGVTSVVKDHLGMVWVGTFKGLNLYDGYEFKAFYSTKDSGLVSNRIQSLYRDKHNNILIGTEKGLSVYHYQQQRFEALNTGNAFSKAFINHITENEKYIICNTQVNGILLINKTDYSFERKILPPQTVNRNFKAFRISFLDENHLLLASNLGLFLVNIETGAFKRILNGKMIYCLDVINDGHGLVYALDFDALWILRVDNKNGNIHFKIESKAFERQGYSKLSLSDKGALWLMKNINELAVATDPSYIKNIEQQVIRFSFTNEFTRLSSIALSENGGWIGSFNQGLYKFSSVKRPFSYSALKSKGQHINKSSQVVSLLSFNKNEVWVTLNANLGKLFDIQHQTIREIENPKINNQVITKILKDRHGNIWGGSRRLGIFQKESLYHPWKQLTPKEAPELEDELVRVVVEDRHGDIWMAAQNALYRFRLDDKGQISEIEKLEALGELAYNNHLIIQVLYPDPKQDCIWIGTESKGGVRLNYSPDKPLKNVDIKRFKPILQGVNSLERHSITCIQRVPKSGLWVGSLEGGISKLIGNEEDLSFKTYTEADGLDDNDVMTFQHDNKGRLWIATNKGINRFDPKTETFQNYTAEDGLVPASFEVSSAKLQNGMMVFGGNNGICYFHPDLISTDTPVPDLLFGDLKIHNQTVKIYDKLSTKHPPILSKPLNETNKIELDYNQNSLSIELISLHFSNTESHKIRHRLLPNEKEWVESSSHNKMVSFSLLPAGEYTLEVAASNTKNEWSPSRKLHIIIHPAWWDTTLAKVLYFVFSILVIVGVMVVLLRLKSLQYKLRLEHLDKIRLEELEATRLKLFMNISHEFRTPLTLISGPISVLKKMFDTNTDAFQHIDLIQRQSKKMFQLVEQVHDLRKADENILKLQMQSFDFTHLITELKRDFEKLAEDSEKRLLLKGEANQLFVMADKYKLEVVINNLLNNAFKFTRKGDEIIIAYSCQENNLSISVEDTGVGIPQEDIPHLFERFYQSSNGGGYSIGSGIGLELSKMLVEMHYGEIKVSSEKGRGAKFEILLPVNVTRKDQLSEERLEELLLEESHEERQRVDKDVIDLSALIKDESHKELTIYYVEDNIDLRHFVSDILAQYFQVATFSNGKECLDKMEEEWPDLILSDILMPEVNGLELCKQIKSDVRTSHIPVILLTSRSSVDERVEGLEVGADTYISKPFDMKHLIASIQNILNNRQKLRERFQLTLPLPLDKKQQSENDKIFLERLYKQLEINLSNEDIDLEELAMELFMSRSQFFRKVKSITNSTPQEIIRSYKLKKAAEFLSEEDLSVADVSVKVGFKSRTHFSKLFKERFELTPSKYAEKYRKRV